MLLEGLAGRVIELRPRHCGASRSRGLWCVPDRARSPCGCKSHPGNGRLAR
jgi:hypothetical protein